MTMPAWHLVQVFEKQVIMENERPVALFFHASDAAETLRAVNGLRTAGEVARVAGLKSRVRGGQATREMVEKVYGVDRPLSDQAVHELTMVRLQQTGYSVSAYDPHISPDQLDILDSEDDSYPPGQGPLND